MGPGLVQAQVGLGLASLFTGDLAQGPNFALEQTLALLLALLGSLVAMGLIVRRLENNG